MKWWVIYHVLLPIRRSRAYRRARRDQSQFCKVCGRAQEEVDFIVSKLAWNAVVPDRWRRYAVCLACFDRFADDRGFQTVKVFLVNGPL